MSDEHGGVPVKPDHTTIGPADLFCRAHDNCAMYVTLFDTASWDRLLDRNDDDVAHRCGSALRATQYLDALDSARAGVVRGVKVRLHLNHGSASLQPISPACPRRQRGGFNRHPQNRPTLTSAYALKL